VTGIEVARKNSGNVQIAVERDVKVKHDSGATVGRGLREREVGHARLDDDALRVEMDFEHAVHPRQRDHDAFGDGLLLVLADLLDDGVGVDEDERAEGFRAQRKEALEGMAQQSAAEVRRTRRPQLLPPLSPWERRLVHLALAEDPELETESEGDGFLKRVEVRLKRN